MAILTDEEILIITLKGWPYKFELTKELDQINGEHNMMISYGNWFRFNWERLMPKGSDLLEALNDNRTYHLFLKEIVVKPESNRLITELIEWWENSPQNIKPTII